jgi:branched-chain amino acid transport system ATP-binding protein
MNAAAQSALVVENLTVLYGAVTAVDDLSLTVRVGEAVAVIGSNGAGKTSLLKAIMGLAPSSSKSILFFGESVAGRPTHALATRGIGYVPEGRELFGGMSVQDELLIGARLLSAADRARKLDQMFALFPRLGERRTQITRTLSGGEQQMLAIARIVVMDPKLLLLDEPSLGLAPVIQDSVYATLDVLKRNGLPILLVEQNAFRALRICERAYVVELGRVTRQGASADLLSDPSIQSAYLGS